MWPDTWSGKKKIYFYSKDGCERTWKLPVKWREKQTVILYPLTINGRGKPENIAIKDGSITINLNAGTPYILE